MAHKFTITLDRGDEDDPSLRKIYTNIANRLEKIFLVCFDECSWFKEVKFEVTKEEDEDELLVIKGSLSVEDVFSYTDLLDFLYNNPYKIPKKQIRHLTDLLQDFNGRLTLDYNDYDLGHEVSFNFYYDELLGDTRYLREDYIPYANEFYHRELKEYNSYHQIKSGLKNLEITFKHSYIRIEYKQNIFVTFEEETKEINNIQLILKMIVDIYKSANHNLVLFSRTN